MKRMCPCLKMFGQLNNKKCEEKLNIIDTGWAKQRLGFVNIIS
jgi:hypothetical protein